MDAKDTELGSLARALSADPLESDVMEIEIRGRKARIRFVELSQTQLDTLRADAIRWAEALRRENEANGEWRDAQIDIDALRLNRADLLYLHAAIIDADTREPVSLPLIQRMTPEVQEFLAQAFHSWKQEISPDGVSEEILEALLEDVKKKRHERGLPVWLWTQFGFQRLSALLLYLVDLQCSSQSDASSGT